MNIEIPDELAIELADAHVAAYSYASHDVQRLIDIVGALLVYIPEPRASVPVVEPVRRSGPVAKAGRGTLTRHQREVYDSIVRMSRRRYDRGVTAEHRYVWVDARNIGSQGAINKLVAKGWIEYRSDFGPRGGEHFQYRPIIDYPQTVDNHVDNGGAS